MESTEQDQDVGERRCPNSTYQLFITFKLGSSKDILNKLSFRKFFASKLSACRSYGTHINFFLRIIYFAVTLAAFILVQIELAGKKEGDQKEGLISNVAKLTYFTNFLLLLDNTYKAILLVILSNTITSVGRDDMKPNCCCNSL